MTPQRAQEILKAGSQWCNWSKHCTPEENLEIMGVWETMPGSTCWYDALCRFAYPKHSDRPRTVSGEGGENDFQRHI